MNGSDADSAPALRTDIRAILDELSDYLVLIDMAGTIRYLNPTWQHFSTGQLSSKPFEPGFAYIRAYTSAFGLSASDAQLLDHTMRQLSSGELARATLDHAYHLTNRQGWFSLHLTPYSFSGERWVLIQQQDTSERKQTAAILRAGEAQFRSLADNIPGAVYRCATSDGWPMFFISPMIKAITGYPASDFVQNSVRTFASLIHPDDLEMVEQTNMQGIRAHRPFEIEYRIIRADASVAWIYEKGQGIYDDDGEVRWLDGILFDITERKQAAERVQQANQQEALIQAQAATIAQLSTPLIPISERVLVMPLIGQIDSACGQLLIATLLQGIADTAAETVIIDITGIPFMDSDVAAMLLNAAKGARLLGTSIMLTGIRPEVAQTLVSLDIGFQGMITLSTLQLGIAAALRR